MSLPRLSIRTLFVLTASLTVSFGGTVLSSSADASSVLPAFSQAQAAEVKLASVDYQRALESVAEGESARKRLETMFQTKKTAIEKMKSNLDAMQADYQKQSVLLSDSAKTEKQEAMNMAGMQFQQAYQQSEGEMQQAYQGAMETLIAKMKTITQSIATERAYTLVIEVNEGGVVYTAPSIDITDELIKRYNAANPVK